MKPAHFLAPTIFDRYVKAIGGGCFPEDFQPPKIHYRGIWLLPYSKENKPHGKVWLRNTEHYQGFIEYLKKMEEVSHESN